MFTADAQKPQFKVYADIYSRANGRSDSSSTSILFWKRAGKFGRSAKFGQQPWLFHILIIGIKNKLTKQTVKIMIRRLIRSPRSLS